MLASFNLHPSEIGRIDVEMDDWGPSLVMTCDDVILRVMLPVTDTPAEALPFVRALHAAACEFLAVSEQYAIAHLDPETGPDPLAA
ncbi:hypothetical protein [Streptacidiphilus rugosus]|uniref:hypothetical protein n=1 Tax=Streptacidiphilus rugosus TaxID=405783 RepID=UPI00056602A7|nr:hypothetical protein [Streptacidiphilus rugosus]